MVGRQKTYPISFRIDQSTLQQLEERAQECGVSAGVYVRGIVVSEIHRPLNNVGGQLTDLDEKLSEVVQAVDELKTRQARSLYYCLTQIGSMSPDVAKELVLTKLNRENRDGRND